MIDILYQTSVDIVISCHGRSPPSVRDRQGGSDQMTAAVTEATFEQEVLSSDRRVLVDFWAEWCSPCRAVSPLLDRIAAEHDLKLVKVNYDEEQQLAERYG